MLCNVICILYSWCTITTVLYEMAAARPYSEASTTSDTRTIRVQSYTQSECIMILTYCTRYVLTSRRDRGKYFNCSKALRNAYSRAAARHLNRSDSYRRISYYEIDPI